MKCSQKSQHAISALFASIALLAIPSTAFAVKIYGHAEEAAVGYLNSGTKLDRVAGEPDYDGTYTNEGRVLVYHNYSGTEEDLWYDFDVGNNAWQKAAGVIHADLSIFGSSARAAHARFGTSPVIGDFDHDGLGDVAFGAPGETVNGHANAGTVYVLYGADFYAPAGNAAPYYTAATKFQQGVDFILGYSEANDFFGEKLAVGDLNCDGIDDLVIGVPREDVMVGSDTYIDAGAINVIYGSNYGLWSYTYKPCHQPIGHSGSAFSNCIQKLTPSCAWSRGADPPAIGRPRRRLLMPSGPGHIGKLRQRELNS